MAITQELKSLVPLGHNGPVTSIQFHENYLIAGCGPLIKIYDWRTSKLICTRRIFSRNKIHGIKINKATNQIAFWGGRSLAFSSIDKLISDDGDDSTLTELALNDWIMYVTFPAGSIKDKSSTLAYILTAHNMVVSVAIENGLILENITCGEKSILYSGVVLALEDGSDVLIGAGTVMSGVVIWSLKTRKVIHNLTSHEGSIFGVRFSDDGKSLISCSDDRSIRLWDVTSGQEVAVGWGHLARIWDLHFYHDKIISVSEDSTARIWTIDLPNKQLITEEVWEGHLGKNAWCGSIQFEYKLFATAGGDGRVRLWQIDEFNTLQAKKVTLSLGDITSYIDPEWALKKNEIFKNYVFLGNGKTVFTTSSGKVLVSNHNTEWRQCYEDRSLDGYSIINSWGEENIIVTSGRDGSLALIRVSDTIEDDILIKIENVFTSKISEVFTWKDASFLYVLSETQNPKDPFIVHKIKLLGTTFSVEETFTLEAPVTFNITSLDYDEEKQLLFAGSRHGAVAVYNLSCDSQDAEILIKPIVCWRRVLSTDDKITTLKIAKKENNAYVVFLTSKGGAYSLIQISFHVSGEFTMQNILLNRTHRGSIEGGYYNAITNRMILYGFRNNLFFVWNESEQYEIMKELCGGPHRIWTFKMNDFNEDFQYIFAYTKAAQICILEKSSQLMTPVIPGTLLQDGLHGREVRCVSFAPESFDINNKNLTRTVATAAEDTCIRLNHVSKDGRLVGHFSYRKHVSGLQQLRWSPDGNYLISSAAREELFVWKVSHVNGWPLMNPLCELPLSTDIPDLRIMDFHLLPLAEEDKADIVTKYLMVTIYSDSSIKLWILDTASTSFTLISSGRYKTCCLLHVNILLSSSSAFILVGATDGHLTIWNIAEILKQHGIQNESGSLTYSKIGNSISPTEDVVSLPPYVCSSQVHQSSVKAFLILEEMSSLNANTYYLLTGGDDNALVLSHVKLDDDSTKISANLVFAEPSAHSATITSIAAVPGTNRVISTGVDQNVKLWAVTDSDFVLLKSAYTTIADTGVCDIADVDGSSIAVIGGSGTSIWSIQ